MAATVGAAGGAFIEAVGIIKAITWDRQMPWNVQSDTIDPPQRRADVEPGEEHLPAPGWKAYWFAGVLRLLVSGALTGVIAASYPQSMNPLVSFLIGLGALPAVQQVTTLVPLMVKSVGRASLGVGKEEALARATRLDAPAAVVVAGQLRPMPIRPLPGAGFGEEEAPPPARSRAHWIGDEDGDQAEAQVHAGLIQLFLDLGPPPDSVKGRPAGGTTPPGPDSTAGADSRSGRGRSS